MFSNVKNYLFLLPLTLFLLIGSSSGKNRSARGFADIFFDDAVEMLLTRSTIEATAYGYGKNRQGAKNAAIDGASVRILEQLSGARISSKRIASESVNLEDFISSEVEGKLRGHEVIAEEIYRFDASTSRRDRFEAKITLRIEIDGKAIGKKIAKTIATDEKKNRSELFTFETSPAKVPSDRAHYRGKAASGLIVDARGLKLETAMAPKIYTKIGDKLRLIYGFSTLPSDLWLNSGMVEYATTLEKAKLLTSRIGKNPLIVKAKEAVGMRFKTDLVVSNEIAVKIFESDLSDLFLERGKVVFIVDNQ